LGSDLKKVHYELKHKMGVIARAEHDDLFAKIKKIILLCLVWLGGLGLSVFLERFSIAVMGGMGMGCSDHAEISLR
jgi:hypothetical protein